MFNNWLLSWHTIGELVLAHRHRWRSTARGAIAEERMDPLSCPAGSVAAWIQNSRCCWWFCWSASAPPQTPGRTQTSQPSRTATGGVHTSVAIGEPRAGVTGACCTAPARGPYAPCSRPCHRRNVTSPNARGRASRAPSRPPAAPLSRARSPSSSSTHLSRTVVCVPRNVNVSVCLSIHVAAPGVPWDFFFLIGNEAVFQSELHKTQLFMCGYHYFITFTGNHSQNHKRSTWAHESRVDWIPRCCLLCQARQKKNCVWLVRWLSQFPRRQGFLLLAWASQNCSPLLARLALSSEAR